MCDVSVNNDLFADTRQFVGDNTDLNVAADHKGGTRVSPENKNIVSMIGNANNFFIYYLQFTVCCFLPVSNICTRHIYSISTDAKNPKMSCIGDHRHYHP